MEPMTGDDSVVQSLRRELAQQEAVIKELQRLQAADAVKVARYDWLEANAKEVYLRPDMVSCEWCPDIRTKWEIPTLICSGPVGGIVSFGEAIDVRMNQK